MVRERVSSSEKKPLLIIPAYNEAAVIKKVIDGLITEYPQYDYVVINDKLEDCVDEIHAIVRSEHSRASRSKDFIRQIREELSCFAKGE